MTSEIFAVNEIIGKTFTTRCRRWCVQEEEKDTHNDENTFVTIRQHRKQQPFLTSPQSHAAGREKEEEEMRLEESSK